MRSPPRSRPSPPPHRSARQPHSPPGAAAHLAPRCRDWRESAHATIQGAADGGHASRQPRPPHGRRPPRQAEPSERELTVASNASPLSAGPRRGPASSGLARATRTGHEVRCRPGSGPAGHRSGYQSRTRRCRSAAPHASPPSNQELAQLVASEPHRLLLCIGDRPKRKLRLRGRSGDTDSSPPTRTSRGQAVERHPPQHIPQMACRPREVRR